MRKLNQAIADLYDASVGARLEDFRAAAFGILREFVPFDSAVWASGRLSPITQGLPFTIHTMHLIGQPAYVPSTFATTFAEDDRLILPAIKRPGVPHRIEDVMPLAEYRSLEVYRTFAHIHQIELAMGTMQIDELVDLIDYVVLWRSDRNNLFADHERTFKQTLSFHMVNAWKHCQLREMERLPSNPFSRQQMVRRARALVDDMGAIYTADADFGTILHGVFPAWRGSQLPHEFAVLAASGQYRGSVAGIECIIARSAVFHVLTVVSQPKTMPLSASEYDVARLFSAGLSNREIATRRRVSTATVRNQIAAVYRKLEVHSKVDLARLIG